MEMSSTSIRGLLRGNILVLTVSRIIWSLSSAIVMPYLSLYILNLGGSKPIIGLVNALGNLAGIFLYPIGGYIADKAGRARLVGFSTLLYASSFLFFALAPDWRWVAAGLIYQQLALFYMPALNAIMADSIPVGVRGRILSLMIAIPGAVRIIAPYIGGLLIAVYTLRPAMRIGYLISFVLGVLVAAMRLRYLEETIEGEGIGRDILGIFKAAYAEIAVSLRWIGSHMRGYTALAIILILVNSIVMPFWVVYATEVIGLTPYQWGVILLIGGVVRTVMSLIAGSLVDRIGAKTCMLIAFAVAAPSMILFTRSRGFLDASLIYVALSLAGVFLWIATSVLLADTIPRAIRGRIMAALGQGVGIGIAGGGYASGFLLFIPMTLGSYVSGYIYQLNPTYPWLIQSITLTAALILAVWLIKEPERAEA